MNKKYPIIIGISAASGIIYGYKLLEFLLKEDYLTEVIISSKAYYISQTEANLELKHDKEFIKIQILNYLNMENKKHLLKIWLDDEFYASPASGSYLTNGMIIAPASMSTLASIANGYSESLISRTADVCIKEKRIVTIVPREAPFSAIHLENMLKLSRLGVNIVPPIFGFYANIITINQGIDFVVGKILDASGISNELFERWNSEYE